MLFPVNVFSYGLIICFILSKSIIFLVVLLENSRLSNTDNALKRFENSCSLEYATIDEKAVDAGADGSRCHREPSAIISLISESHGRMAERKKKRYRPSP